MKLILRILLLWIVLVCLDVGIASIAHDRGYELALYGNLPHRSLGSLWTAHMLLPYRQQYAEDYLTQYVFLTREEMLMEGSRTPVMLQHASSLMIRFPDSVRIRNAYNDLRAMEKKKRT